MDGMHPPASSGTLSDGLSTPLCVKRKRPIDDHPHSFRQSPVPLEPTPSFLTVDSESEDEGPQTHEVKYISAPSRPDAPKYGNPAQDLSLLSGARNFDPTEPNLSKEQQDLVELILSGRNVFYTGSAGCGKSTVLKAAVRKLHRLGKNVHIIAPTGRAALQVNGMSTWSYMGWTPDYHKLPLRELTRKGFRKHVKARLKSTHVLIIDEISMIENHHLERINECMKTVRCWSELHKSYHLDAEAFGGVQLIVTGDFCQLPPVNPFQHCMECGLEMIPDEDDDNFNCPKNHGPFREVDKWAFKSAAWEEANFIHVNLQEVHRQSDETFIRMLQKCRLGIAFSQFELETLTHHACKVHNATRLLCTRDEVSKVNQHRFNRMLTPIVKYTALDGFDWNQKGHPHLEHYRNEAIDGTLEQCKQHRLEPALQLRAGMLIMLQVNLDIRRGLVNGSQGIICGWEDFDREKLPRKFTNQDKKAPARDKDGKPLPVPDTISGDYASLKEVEIRNFMDRHTLISKWPRVLFHNGIKRTIYPSCIVNTVGDGEPYSLLYRTQIPLTAGWALSVHKAQGMTLDRVIVNLSKAFEEGQVYVALSRATSLAGLMIEGDPEGLKVGYGGNADVREFLMAKFGQKLFLDHGGSTISSSQESLC